MYKLGVKLYVGVGTKAQVWEQDEALRCDSVIARTEDNSFRVWSSVRTEIFDDVLYVRGRGSSFEEDWYISRSYLSFPHGCRKAMMLVDKVNSNVNKVYIREV